MNDSGVRQSNEEPSNESAREQAHADATPKDKWDSGADYEAYVGRWSALVAEQFLAWLAPPPNQHWLDVGCGTGALSRAILARAQPAGVTGIDASPAYAAYAREIIVDQRVAFQVGDAQALPFASDTFDFAVSGLVLNFVPEPRRMVNEMLRVARRGGTVALYVWDYSAGMELMRMFWDAATELDPAAADLDEGRRFPITHPNELRNLFSTADARAIDVPTLFESFNDFWDPFLAGQGPAPGYVRALPDAKRAQLRAALHARLPIAGDGSIALTARAWAVRASVERNGEQSSDQHMLAR